MGTSNFSRLHNASRYFTVLMNREEKFIECEECEQRYFEHDDDEFEERKCSCGCTEFTEGEECISPEAFEIEEFTYNIQSDFQEAFERCEDIEEWLNRGERSFSRVNVYRYFGDTLVDIDFVAYRSTGYYEGANLDFQIKVYDGFQNIDLKEYNDLDSLLECTFEDSSMNAGLIKIQKRNAKKWIENQIQIHTEKIEKIFSQYSEYELIKVGQFSNGEAIYQSAV